MAVWKNNDIKHAKSLEVVTTLQMAVVAVKEDKLGFKAKDIGAHSIRLKLAMQMFLGECLVYIIMMIGRWSSDTFLCYIQK